MTSPTKFSGTTTSTSITGSSSRGFARAVAAFIAMEPAILNAISLESTSWKEPSRSVTLTSTSGYPARGPS